MNCPCPVAYEFRVNSLAETINLGRVIGKCVSAGSVIGLRGPLGAGKTELVRGIAQGLGIFEDISSPTFVLEVVYEIPPRGSTASLRRPLLLKCAEVGPKSFHHWDLYRITSGVIDCEIYDYSGDPERITAVEWPERVPRVEDLLAVEILIDFADPQGSCGNEDGFAIAIDCGERKVLVNVRSDHSLAEGLKRLQQNN
jgi:tRNA threonylcarbamoyladenosine biosynthesis protein TsaE